MREHGLQPRRRWRYVATTDGDQGMTLGPTTGRMLTEMIAGEQPFLDARPYQVNRF